MYPNLKETRITKNTFEIVCYSLHTLCSMGLSSFLGGKLAKTIKGIIVLLNGSQGGMSTSNSLFESSELEFFICKVKPLDARRCITQF